MGERGRLGWVIVYVDDVTAAVELYRRPDPAEPPCNVESAFVFDDVDAAYARALAEGCAPLAAPQVKPHGQTVAYVRDPFGTLVEVASPLG